MLINTKHLTLKNNKKINQMVGLSYNFLQILNKGGTGSKKMIIDHVSENMALILNKSSGINYGNIELRPKGVLIHISKGICEFIWSVPYNQLIIEDKEGLKLKSNDNFIHFINNKTLRENENFFNKLISEKNLFEKENNSSL